MTVSDLVGLVYNSQVPEAAPLVDTLVESLHLRETSWSSPVAELEGVEDKLRRTGLIVVVGGDGTILRTVRVIAPFGVPIVGVNVGRVGFITELEADETVEKLPMYLDGELRVEERMMLEASVTSDSEPKPRITVNALNEVVVARGSVARLHDIHTSVDGVPLTSYRADAVIVSTATGSTGYALSSGGPILYPEARVVLVLPVAAHTGLRDSLILPEESVIELRASDSHEVILSADGFLDTVLETQDKVTVKRSRYVARFLRSQPPGRFYSTLTRRLGPTYR